MVGMISCDYYKEVKVGMKKVGTCIRPEFQYEGEVCPYVKDDVQDKCLGAD